MPDLSFSRKGKAMYFYAYLNEQDICVEVYDLPSPVSGSQYISLPSYDTSKLGMYFDREEGDFFNVYYYAVLNEKNIVTEVTFFMEQQVTSNTLRSITFEQYETVNGLYWDGTGYIVPPIHIAAVASTDQINYKAQDKWLSTKLDEIDTAISGKADNDHTHVVSDVAGLSTLLSGVADDIDALETAVSGKANASHTHTAADLSGVIKTVNGNAPDSSGNIVVPSGSMTAAEILSEIETVDGANSGLDADKLDGLEATAFATADHNHDDDYSAIDHTHAQYLTGDDIDAFEFVTGDDLTDALEDKADATHYHTMENVTGLVTALAGKSDTNHNHDTAYAGISHSHVMDNITGLATALAGKSDTSHTHEAYVTTTALNTALAGKADSSHSHTMENVTGLVTALAGKSDTSHNHDTAYAGISHSHVVDNITGLATALAGKADSSHSHAISDVTGLQSELNGKSDTDHTHSDYLSTSGGTLSGDLNVNGVIKANGQQAFYYSSGSQTIGTNNATSGTIVACGSSADVTVNGARMQVPSLLPRNGGTFQIGNTSNRFSGIYLTNQPNVSSDERLKECIRHHETSELLDFVNGLEVVDYRYLADSTDRIGLIAQQVIKTNPEIAKYFVEEDSDGYYSMKPADLVFPLIAAVQELKKQIDEMKK